MSKCFGIESGLCVISGSEMFCCLSAVCSLLRFSPRTPPHFTVFSDRDPNGTGGAGGHWPVPADSGWWSTGPLGLGAGRRPKASCAPS